MEWLPIVLVVVVVAIVAAVVYANHIAQRRRTEELQSLAPELGFSLEPGSKKPGESGLDLAMFSLPLFKRGRAARVRNVMRAQHGEGEEIVFDFRYTVSSGQHSHTVEQTVLATRRRGGRLPTFRLHPEGLFDKLGQMFGGKDIDFDSNTEFSKRYVLKGEDPDAVRAFFERQAVTFLADRPGWSAEGAGEWLIVFRASKREKVERMREWLDQARQIARVLDSR